MDYLVVNDFLRKKTEQPDWENREKWMEKFKLGLKRTSPRCKS